MANKKTANNILKQIPLVVAMLAAFVFSASNGFQPLLMEEAVQAEQQPEQEQNDESRPVAYLYYACDAIAPVAQLQFFHTTFKVILPTLQVRREKPQLLPSLRGSDRFFRTLFQLIISPNAP